MGVLENTAAAADGTALRSGEAWERERACKKAVNPFNCVKPSSLFGKSHYRKLMLSLMPLLAIGGVVAYVFATLKMLTAAIEAPIGYENDEGFHYGIAVSETED